MKFHSCIKGAVFVLGLVGMGIVVFSFVSKDKGQFGTISPSIVSLQKSATQPLPSGIIPLTEEEMKNLAGSCIPPTCQCGCGIQGCSCPTSPCDCGGNQCQCASYLKFCGKTRPCGYWGYCQWCSCPYCQNWGCKCERHCGCSPSPNCLCPYQYCNPGNFLCGVRNKYCPSDGCQGPCCTCGYYCYLNNKPCQSQGHACGVGDCTKHISSCATAYKAPFFELEYCINPQQGYCSGGTICWCDCPEGLPHCLCDGYAAGECDCIITDCYCGS